MRSKKHMQTQNAQAIRGTSDSQTVPDTVAGKEGVSGLPPAHAAWPAKDGLPPQVNLQPNTVFPTALPQPKWRRHFRSILVAGIKTIHSWPPAYRVMRRLLGQFRAVDMRLVAYVDPEAAARMRAEGLILSRPPVVLSDATLYCRIHAQLEALSRQRTGARKS